MKKKKERKKERKNERKKERNGFKTQTLLNRIGYC